MRSGTRARFSLGVESVEVRVMATAGVGASSVAAAVAAHHHQTHHPHAVTKVGAGEAVVPKAWVRIENGTNQAVQFRLKLYPYADGQLQTVTLAPYRSESFYSDLIQRGKRVEASFALQFTNGPLNPLATGSTAASATKYFIYGTPGNHRLQQV